MKQRNIGRYQIKSEIDHGGMSVVYLAHDPRFRRDVAVKVLSSNLQGQAQVRARFEREARIIASLDHPAIVPVYDFGEDENQPYLVMRLMPGGSLSDLLTFGRLNLSDTAHITERIGSALDIAHSHGVVHRDLKPANILFDATGEAFLTDFGIVKLFEGESAQVDMTGSIVLGTPAYMSPEQALGKPIDKRSDVYSLGAVIYEMLTGLPPYKGPTGVSVAMKHVMEPVPHVAEFRSDIPAELDKIVARAMAKEPMQRYDSASELARAFADAVHARPQTEQQGDVPAAVTARKPITEASTRLRLAPTAHTPKTPNDTQMQHSRRWLLWLGITAGVLAFIGIALVVVAALIAPANESSAVIPPLATATKLMALPQVVTKAASTTTSQQQTNTNAATATTPSDDVGSKKPIMIVNAGGGRARSGPGTNYPVLTALSESTQLLATATVRGTDGSLWLEFTLPEGQRGFVREDVVTLMNVAAFDLLPTAANIPRPPARTATATATATR